MIHYMCVTRQGLHRVMYTNGIKIFITYHITLNLKKMLLNLYLCEKIHKKNHVLKKIETFQMCKSDALRVLQGYIWPMHAAWFT